MKTILASLLLLGATALHAQVTLENFSSLISPNTQFFGDWSASGDPFSGDPNPAATFSQGAGFYNVTGVSDSDQSSLLRSFTSALNLSADDQLSLSLKLLGGNTAGELTVLLSDTSFNTASATFNLSSFTTAGFTQQTVALNLSSGFSLAHVSSFQITGGDPFGSGTVSVALDNLAAASSRPLVAVPEPSTYGFLAASGLLALAALRRRSRK